MPKTSRSEPVSLDRSQESSERGLSRKSSRLLRKCCEVFMMTQTRLSIRRNDTVQVMAGREKGKSGKVLRVDAKNGKILVDKLNMVKRHLKPSQQHPQGGILEKESAIHYSNVLL